MVTQANLQWKRLRHYLAAEPGRFAGGSALSEPLGLLAVERERLTAPQDTGGRPVKDNHDHSSR